VRDEDKTFAEIVQKEFDEQWEPSTPAVQPPAKPAVTPAAQVEGPLPDFHLNLYDDDESYREVPHTTWRMSHIMMWGLSLIVIGIVVAVAKIAPMGLPLWIGWVSVGCFIAGGTLCLWHITHAPRDDDENGTV